MEPGQLHPNHSQALRSANATATNTTLLHMQPRLSTAFPYEDYPSDENPYFG